MKLEKISIVNYKGLKETNSQLDNFSCVIGENNAGKSSLLQSILLLIKGTKLTKHEYYDPEQEILFTGVFSGLTEELLGKLDLDHKKKLEKYVANETITLARRYAIDGSSKLRVVTSIPCDEKYHEEKISATLKGKTGKNIGEALNLLYPEIALPEVLGAIKTQVAAKELIEAYVKKLPTEELMLTDIPLITGIDNSISAILPEPVYIPAVKDFSDDLKTKESASFGKLLHILLEVIEGDLSDAVDTFEKLRKKLNRITCEDGLITDERMERVKSIEATIQKNLQETFKDVSIELNIPPPEIKSILSSATIYADDGTKGPIESKGDGFKRAITFSILRTYVQLSQQQDWKKPSEKPSTIKDGFIFLFEEPELYLHPHAQNILFEALSLISKTQQVLVTTHSPLFFSPTITKTFIKIYKTAKIENKKPKSECLTINLNDMPTKDQLQLISFETGSHAFFSRKVILVEGDSELIAIPHMAKMINEMWDIKANSISLVKTNGKGSFKRYYDFFSKFNVQIALFADLDLLIKDFDKINPTEEIKSIRSDLLAAVDQIIKEENLLSNPNKRLITKELQSARVKLLYEKLLIARNDKNIESQFLILEEIFIFEKTQPRLEVLSDDSRIDILLKKRKLLSALRALNIFVLEKGEIEAYYPATVVGDDKPTKAQSFCNEVRDKKSILALCSQINTENGPKPELELIMESIFPN